MPERTAPPLMMLLSLMMLLLLLLLLLLMLLLMLLKVVMVTVLVKHWAKNIKNANSTVITKKRLHLHAAAAAHSF